MLKIIIILGILFNNIIVFAQWEIVPDSLKDISAIHLRDNNVFCGTLGNIYYSSNNGDSWIQKNQGLKYWSSVVSFASNDTVIIIGCSGDGVYVSTDNGSTWIEKDNGLSTKNVINVIIHNNLFFAGEEYNPITSEQGGLYISSNGGNSWNKVSGIPPGNVYKLLTDKVNVYAGLTDGLYRSTDNGINWTKVFNHFVNSIETINNDILVATGDSLFFSSNNGDTWERRDNGLNIEYIGDLAVIDSLIFASGSSRNGKIFVSYDLGNNWYPIYSNLPDSTNGIASIATNQNYLFLSINAGYLWRRQINTITNLEYEKLQIPKHFILFQNYPNPFNPSTNIKFSIPKSAFVTLKIYDVLGKEVAELVNENLNAGTYNYNFDASKLSSGVYLYHIVVHSDRIQSDNFIETKKMILLH